MPPSPTMTASPRRRRWWPLLVGSLGLGLGGVVLLRSDWLARRLAMVLEDQIESLTGEHATVASVRLHPLERVVRVDGIVVRHRSPEPERDGVTVAAVERITLALGVRDLKPRLRRLELDRPMVHLHLDEGKLREFQGLPSGNGTPAERLPWDQLYIRDGTVVLSTAYGGDDLAELRIEELDAAPGDLVDSMSIDADLISIRLGEWQQEAHAVHLPDLEVSPRRVHAPEIALVFPDLSLSGSLELEPLGPVAGVFSISTRLDAWDPLMPRRLTATGKVQADFEVHGQTQAPVIGGTLLGEDLALFMERQIDPTLPPLRYGLGDVLASWRVTGRQLLVEPLEADWADGQVVINGAVDLASTGVWASIEGVDIGLAAALRAMDVAPNPWVDMGADLEIQAAGTLSPLTLAGSWTIAARDLHAANGPVPATPPMLDVPRIHARGELRLVDDGIRLQARPVRTPRSTGSADVRIGFGPRGPLDLDLVFSALDLRDLAPLGDIELSGLATLDATLAGPFNAMEIDGVTDIANLRIWDLPFADRATSPLHSDLVRLSFPEVHARRGTTPWQGSIDIDFSDPVSLDMQTLVGPGRLSDVLGIFLELPGLESGMEGTLELHGPVDLLDGEARVQLDDIDLFGEHFESGVAIGWMDAGRFTLDEAAIQRLGGKESIIARGRVGAGWQAHVDIHGGGFRLEGMDLLAPLDGRLRGRLSLDAVVEGTLFEPEPRGWLRLADTRIGRRELQDSGLAFVTHDGTLLFEGQLASNGALLEEAQVDGQLDSLLAGRSQLALAGSLGLWDAQPYAVDVELQDFALDALYPEAPDGSPISALVSGSARVSGAFGDQPTPVDVSATVTDTRLAWGRHSLRAAQPWTWSQRGEDYALDDFHLVGGGTDLKLYGQRRQQGVTRFGGGGSFDLDLLRTIVPGLERSEGLALVEITGATRSGRIRPEVTVEVAEATIRGDWFPATFESVEGQLRVDPDGLEIQRATGRLGGGRLEGSGTIALEGFAPRRYDLSGSVRNGRVRYFDWLPAATGNAEITFSGPSDAPLLSGRVDIQEMLFTDRIDWESWVLEISDEVLGGAVEEVGRDWFSMDLSLTAEDTIRVRNNVGDLTADADLRVIGDTARPGLVGRVAAEPGGRVYLKEREFELLRGEIRFVDPYTYDPELDFALTTTVESTDQEYRIDAEIGGSWTNWRTTTRSTPNLVQADINALVLFGMTREEMERSGALTQALAIEGGDVLVSRIGIVEQAGEGVFRIRGLEPLLDPLRPERLDLVSGSSDRGSGEVSSELRLLYENDLADIGWTGGQLIIEQNIAGGQDTYVGLEQRLARRLYLRGWWGTEQLERNLQIGGAYGVEISLRWEFE